MMRLVIAPGFGINFEKEIRPIFEARCLDSGTLKGGIGRETFYHALFPPHALLIT